MFCRRVLRNVHPQRHTLRHSHAIRDDSFVGRHIGSYKKTEKMLKSLGLTDLEQVVADLIPSEIRLKQTPLAHQPSQSEHQALQQLRTISQRNHHSLHSCIGMGYDETLTPPVLVRNLLENPGWYSAYTPYQAEVSQGRLESLLNFQTVVSDLTGLAVAGASLLDEGTAAAEAMALAFNNSTNKKNNLLQFFVSSSLHPQTIGVLKTRASLLQIPLDIGEQPLAADESYFGGIWSYPNTVGSLAMNKLEAFQKANPKAICIARVDLLALTLLKPVHHFGFQVAIGSAQRLGVPMMYGGPHAGFIASTEKFHRKLPGRIIGISKDAHGNPALRMAMQTREQHIRRDKATSNICTAQALLANVAAMYAVYHGPEGLREIASRIHNLTKVLYDSIGQSKSDKFRLVESEGGFFDTICVECEDAEHVVREVEEKAQINLRLFEDKKHIGISIGESTTLQHVQSILDVFKIGMINENVDTTPRIDPTFLRDSQQDPYLTASVFHAHRSETQLMRYLKKLESKDLSLNTSMISLGSCTMKLNAVAELEAITWPQFSHIHPFAPQHQTKGYEVLIKQLHEDLAAITGFDAMSSQPNSGAQGEYAGLITIRRYQNNPKRRVCLIPVSAHGTNPASAVMAGLKVVPVKSDAATGTIDREDLERLVKKHQEELCCLMLTYPSTYGVFEQGVEKICDLIHEAGGQVYLDGANMNAQVGFCTPGGSIGADVCHLNLHKTFCIPHGGGGPGVGTIGVKKHLAPFLPGNSVISTGGEGENVVAKSEGAISSAPFGSAGILPIPYMYIKLMGGEGLRQATLHAILHANYMANRLSPHYGILFRSKDKKISCAHEFILDVRPFKKVGVTEEDVAKRLQDYGFHSPTMSWPVSGTLMIEPTESEDQEEMDRFCDALISIREEIRQVESGEMALQDSPLRNAPHTLAAVTSSQWEQKYSRETAAFPAKWQQNGLDKNFWPTVGRIDNVHGDRHLVCTCPPMESYVE